MFSITELTGMREVQESHMMDTCVIYRVVARTKNTRGETIKTFGKGFETICGLQMDPTAKEYGASFIEANIDAVLRLPLDVVVDPDDEIEITHRFGERLRQPRRYEVQRYTNDGPSGCRAYLKARTIA